MSATGARRREYAAGLVLLATGGVLGLIAAARPWGSARMTSSLEVTSTTVSGSDLLPFAPAVCLVAITAVVAVPAMRRIGRWVVGGVLAILGTALAVVALVAVTDLEGRIESWVTSDGGSGVVEDVSTSPGWGFAVVVAGVMVLSAGLLIAVRGPSWPGMGAKYERRLRNGGRDEGPVAAGDGGRVVGSGGPDADERVSARETWDALDRGDDPT